MIGSSMVSMEPGSGSLAGRVDLDDVAAGLRHAVADGGRGDEQLEVELALEPLLHDLHVEQAEEPAAEAEAQGGRGLGLVEERRVVQAQLLEGVAQLGVLVRIHRVEPGEHHGLDFLEAGQGLRRRPLVVGQGVADGHFRDLLDAGDHESDLARGERFDGHGLGREDAQMLDFVGPAGGHQADLHLRLQLAVDDVDQDDHAAVLVEPGVEHERPHRALGIALRRRNAMDDRLQDLVDADALLGARPGWRGRHRCR